MFKSLPNGIEVKAGY